MRSLKQNMAGALYAAAILGATAAQAVTINGAGASFPDPVYQRWLYEHSKTTTTNVNYQSVGSGAGISAIKAKTVDFGGTDEPLKVDALDAANLAQFPMLMGGVVPVVNIPEVEPGQLKLSGAVLADIFLGKVKKWNAPAIAALNPDLKLPELDITVAHRSDGSGTTSIFTHYLAKASDAWKTGPGVGKDVRWPAGIGGQKNPGVANIVEKTSGAIGYVEYTYAVEANLSHVTLQNQAGKFVQPTMESFAAAGANADWDNAPGFCMDLTNQPGDESWPITGVTYILVQKQQPDAAKADAMFKYFDWCFAKGGKIASSLNYVAMPEAVVAKVRASWDKITADGKPVWK